MAKATFELFTDRKGEYRWRLRHDNGNIIATGGESYSSKASAKKNIESVQKNAGGADVVEVASTAK
ncbi:HVO_2922 family protein [Haloarchaeobius amylolyticus]|uniref:HVO_2922 family protein n=1 Tax=Haloarchaeobius amylolyticus TaxID=1198296 RepID=UPI00226E26B2|nr:HVO_2922 family protein [Haloarchaeobius amylolyticus]